MPLPTPVEFPAFISSSWRHSAARTERDITFFQRDLRQLTGLGPFGAAVCLYDSFNYLLTPVDVTQALDEIYSILSPAGLFVFDVCTEQNSLRYFHDIWDMEEGPDFIYQRHSYYDSERHLQFNHFHIKFDGQDIRLEETHTHFQLIEKK